MFVYLFSSFLEESKNYGKINFRKRERENMEVENKGILCVGLLFIAILVLLTSGCGVNEMKSGTLEGYSYEEVEEKSNYVKLVTNDDKVILMELYPDVAPITVANFQKLVSEKFYDGLIFHRVIEGFMIQTGDPTGTGSGGSEEKIKGEFLRNGVENTLKHEKGVLSMARTSVDNDSASSQFFIMVSDDHPYLDGDYAAFGRVIAGYEVVEEISLVKTDSNDKPYHPQKIRTIRFVSVEKQE